MAEISTARGLAATDHDALLGAQCTACDVQTFPAQAACPRCGAPTAECALPTRGVLWSWMVQRFRPKPPYEGPDEFEPYVVGYVDLGDVKVEGRLDGRPVDAWTIGDPVRLELGEPDDDGAVWSYRWVADDGGAS